jgi:hypothetical protein
MDTKKAKRHIAINGPTFIKYYDLIFKDVKKTFDKKT